MGLGMDGVFKGSYEKTDCIPGFLILRLNVALAIFLFGHSNPCHARQRLDVHFHPNRHAYRDYDSGPKFNGFRHSHANTHGNLDSGRLLV